MVAFLSQFNVAVTIRRGKSFSCFNLQSQESIVLDSSQLKAGTWSACSSNCHPVDGNLQATIV
jgi:hypothetical protein